MIDASVRSVLDLIERVRAEYLEMPGLSLTPAQLARLCGIDRKVCDQVDLVLQVLSDQKFLGLTPDGRYVRLTDVGIDPATSCARHSHRECAFEKSIVI